MLNSIFNAIDFDLQKAVLDNYQLKEGLYVRVGKRIKYFIFKNSKKAIDPPKKKIQNNNYLTLFAKEKEFTLENKDYFLEKLRIFKTFKSFRKKAEKKILKSFTDYVFILIKA